MRAERFELMARLAKLPQDTVFFTQITMEAAEDPEFLDAMRKAQHQGRARRRRGRDARRAEGHLQGLQSRRRRAGASACATFKEHGVHVLGSFIFGLPSDRPATFDATAALAEARRHHVRAVRDADAVPGHDRLRQVGEEPRRHAAGSRRHAAHAALADSRVAPAEVLHAASDDVARRGAGADAGGVGSVLQPARDLEAQQVRRRRSRAGSRSC